ncbi:helicase associated domain-containing protein (plasmid) [Gordonia amicalis]|nr:helicase associated domain-containing protein [Gordonia amicalis]UOG23821.1 helicase associated domain-containing protein [Gordonia amicalis]
MAHLHRYAAEHCSSSPPRNATIDGFAIGQWVVNRRAEYRRGRLSPERIARLETGFPGWVWNVRDTMFDRRRDPSAPLRRRPRHEQRPRK